jgi:hypothetical protein
MKAENEEFGSLKMSEKISVRGNGLVAVEDIEPCTVLLSVSSRDVVSCSNIPNEFKQKLMFLRKQKFVSTSTHIEKELTFESELLMLYLIYLRSTLKAPFFQQWFQRPLTAMYYFDRKILD